MRDGHVVPRLDESPTPPGDGSGLAQLEIVNAEQATCIDARADTACCPSACRCYLSQQILHLTTARPPRTAHWEEVHYHKLARYARATS